MELPAVKKKSLSFTDRELWEKYWMVTQELLKFIKAGEIETFLDLVNQRQRLMEMMQALPKEQQDFRHTEECTVLREKIRPMDMEIIYRARTWLNKSRRNTIKVKSYDGYGSYGTAGVRFNKEF